MQGARKNSKYLHQTLVLLAVLCYYYSIHFSAESEVNPLLYLTVKQQLKHLSVCDYKVLKELSHIAKNLYNQGLYNVRQHFFSHN
ncbi:MAG: hypothetical protein ACK5LL_02840, partial [Suipraeoptans sp.]